MTEPERKPNFIERKLIKTISLKNERNQAKGKTGYVLLPGRDFSRMNDVVLDSLNAIDVTIYLPFALQPRFDKKEQGAKEEYFFIASGQSWHQVWQIFCMAVCASVSKRKAFDIKILNNKMDLLKERIELDENVLLPAFDFFRMTNENADKLLNETFRSE